MSEKNFNENENKQNENEQAKNSNNLANQNPQISEKIVAEKSKEDLLKDIANGDVKATDEVAAPSPDLPIEAKKEQIIDGQTDQEIMDKNIQAADGITTASDYPSEEEVPVTSSEKPTQGVISQDAAKNAILENRKLRKELATLKRRFGVK